MGRCYRLTMQITQEEGEQAIRELTEKHSEAGIEISEDLKELIKICHERNVKLIPRLSRAESMRLLRKLLRNARRAVVRIDHADPEEFVVLQNDGKPAVPCSAEFPDRKRRRDRELFFSVQTDKKDLLPLRNCHDVMFKEHCL